VAAGRRRAGRERADRAVGERTDARVRGWRARGRGVLGRGLGGGRGRSRFSERWWTFSKNDRSAKTSTTSSRGLPGRHVPPGVRRGKQRGAGFKISDDMWDPCDSTRFSFHFYSHQPPSPTPLFHDGLFLSPTLFFSLIHEPGCPCSNSLMSKVWPESMWARIRPC
jgi:hypothetical protein